MYSQRTLSDLCQDDNRLPRNLLGALEVRRRGGHLKTLRKSYLDLLRKLQFDSNDTSDSSIRLQEYFKRYPETDLQRAC